MLFRSEEEDKFYALLKQILKYDKIDNFSNLSCDLITDNFMSQLTNKRMETRYSCNNPSCNKLEDTKKFRNCGGCTRKNAEYSSNWHYYIKDHKGNDDFAAPSDTNAVALETRHLYKKIVSWQKAWETVSDKELGLHFTEWNVQKNLADQLEIGRAHV